MKKQIKIISLAAATLLAVAPAAASTVYAESTTNVTNTTTNVSNTNPVITYDSKTYDQDQSINDVTDNAPFNYIPVRTMNAMSDTVAAIQKAFTATASSSDKTPVTVKVNMDSFNWEVAGRYPTTVSATNAAGKTTTLSFDLYVGAKNSGAVYANAKNPDGGNLYVFNIKDNKVTKAPVTIKSNTDLATFGTVTVNNVSYTRLNSADSDIYIHTSDITGNSASSTTPTTKPTPAAPVNKTLMHTALLYNKDGKSLGTKYYSYRTVSVLPNTVTINGSKYYKLALGVDYNEAYIKAVNIDGTKRKLKHNAYIYSTSTRRTTHKGAWKLYKGSTVTTYGGSYKFKNGKRYYRIGGPAKQYVRTSNFN